MEMWLINFCGTPRKQHLFLEKENAIMNMISIVGAACAAVAITAAMPAVTFADGDVVTPVFEQAISNIPSKSLIATVVDYPPGGTSLPHTHAKSAFIFAYVLAGEIESQVNDGPKRVYRAGESFYETPGSSHPISRNASKSEPAKQLAVFVVDTNDKPLTTPVN
jgi:quercetin dioxygenase-like cupin family protein